MRKLSIVLSLLLVMVMVAGVSADEYQTRFESYGEDIEDPGLLYNVFPAAVSPNYTIEKIKELELNRGARIEEEGEDGIVFLMDSQFMEHLIYYELERGEVIGGMVISYPVKEIINSGMAGEMFSILNNVGKRLLAETYYLDDFTVEIDREIGSASISRQIIDERIDLFSFANNSEVMAGISIDTIDELSFSVIWGLN